MSSESSSNSSEGSTSGSSLKSASSESKSIGSGDNPIESGNHPRSAGGPESSLPPDIIQGYNSEDYHRTNLEFSRFAINRIRENRINNSRLSIYREEFSIPSDVGLRIPNMGEQVSNPEPGCVAIHPAFLEIGMCLPLQPYVRSPNSWRILIGMWCLWRLNGIDTDPTLSEIKHCYKPVGHARGSDGWWHLSSWSRLSGHSLIIGQPSSNKEWKKTWFVATTGWGRELTIGGREQRVRSVFGFPVNIIPEPSSLRLANSKRSFGKKKKLAGKSDKGKMPDKEVAPSRRGKSVASKRPRRTLPKGSLGAKIPEEFIKGVSSKRARVTTETSDQVLPEQEVLGDADPSSAMPPVPPRGGKSKAGSTESVRGGDKRRRSHSPSAFHRPLMGSGVPPTFTYTRPGVSQSSVDAIFSPDQSVDFICDNARNFMRSTDPGATGKMSNDDRIRIATGATDHIVSEGPPDNFDRRLIPEVRWVGHSDLFDRRLISHDLLVVSIGGLGDLFDRRLVPYDLVIFSIAVLDHFVRGFYLSVGYQCQHNFFDLRIPGLWVRQGLTHIVYSPLSSRYNAPCKLLDFLCRPRTSQLLNRPYLIWVGIDSTMVDHEAKEFSRTYSKGAFLWVELHLVSSELVRSTVATNEPPTVVKVFWPISTHPTLAFSNIWSIGNFSGVCLSNLLLGILHCSTADGDAFDIHRSHAINLRTNKLEGDTDWMVDINPPTIKLERNYFLIDHRVLPILPLKLNLSLSQAHNPYLYCFLLF
ncbi:hypothetical protein ACOSQ4_000903 [Xanthoceras sorbifolium]